MKLIAKGIVVLLAIICVLPVLFIITGAFMGNEELLGILSPVLIKEEGYAAWHFIPLYPTLRNLVELLFDTPEYYVLFWNSIKIVVCILVGQMVFAVPAAWGFAQSREKWTTAVFLIYIFCMLLPFQVTMLSQYLILNSLSMINTQLSLIVPMVFSTFPVFIIYSCFKQMPVSVIEAAQLDGAGKMRIFLSMAIPIGAKGILAAMILGFLEYWNMVEQPVVFLEDMKKWPLSVYLPEFEADMIGRAFTFSMFSIIPALVVFALGRNILADGIAISGGDE
ncbi:MAG: carbohydrate ABC transporter permease [Lachnospiraceae bacterium]|nr:carbohydrate ABC transporter permease [Lachnospiraceae bacterium]